MNVKQILNFISLVASRKGISRVFVCGGTPRDKVMGRLDRIADIDITTGDESIHRLGKEVNIALPGSVLIDDKDHSHLIIDDIKIDLSSNFRVPGVAMMLREAGLQNPSPMQCELYSRDFTCNALLMSTDLKTITDPTGLGISDIKAKKLRTCLPAELTLGTQHKRIARIPYLAAKLGFEVDAEILEWCQKHPQFIADCNSGNLSEKLKKAMSYDAKKTVQVLDEMYAWKYVPAIPELVPFIAKKIL